MLTGAITEPGAVMSMSKTEELVASTSGRDHSSHPLTYSSRTIPSALLQSQPSTVRSAQRGVQALAHHIPLALVTTIHAANAAIKPTWSPSKDASKAKQQGLGHPASSSWAAGSQTLLATISSDLSASTSGRRGGPPSLLPWSWGQWSRQRAAPSSAQARDTLLARGCLVLDMGRAADEAPRLVGPRSVDARWVKLHLAQPNH